MSSNNWIPDVIGLSPGSGRGQKLTGPFILCYTETMDRDIVTFEEMEHTADIGLRARGRSLEELFVNAARGMLWLMGFAGEGLEEGRLQTIEIQGLDREHLLVRWLSEILYLFREGRAVQNCDFQCLEPSRLRARCRTVRLPPGFVYRQEIKLVTHHRVKIECRGGIYTGEVIFDV
jgi:SHS2 domain-containing protein